MLIYSIDKNKEDGLIIILSLHKKKSYFLLAQPLREMEGGGSRGGHLAKKTLF